MDVADLRKRILRALDEARREAATRRQAADLAAVAYEAFLSQVAVPLMQQAAQVLRADGHGFAVHTPASTVRLVSDASASTFIELTLDTSGAQSEVLGRVSLTRGRHGQVVAERPLASGEPIAELTEDDVSAFLIAEIPKLLVRS